MTPKNELILYQAEELTSRIEVLIENETVWLSKAQMASLYGRDRSVISRHINNIFKEGELQKSAVCAFFAHTTKHGASKEKKQVTNVEHYNLDVIISVGYRVKSKQGTQFRIWANSVLKDYLLKGYALNNRVNRMEENIHALTKKVTELNLQIHPSLTPKQGIFYDGEVFDAYLFVVNLIKSAKKSIILIDNYIDESILQLLTKRNRDVKATIYTGIISRVLQQDLKKHNAQYPEINIEFFKKSHDRFLIIDGKSVFHIGASLKDLGKKWVAFSKMNISALQMITNLKRT